MKSNSMRMVLAILVALSLILTACGGPAPAKTTDVTVQLKWLHNVQFAGNYVAAQEGYYKEAGLNVTLNPISFDEIASIEDLVATGKADFGISGADQVLIARSQGKPLKVVAVIFRINPLVLVSMDDIVINKPADLIGKTVAAHKGQAQLVYKAVMQNAGVDMSLVKLVEPTTFDALECLGSADVCSAYSTDGVVGIERGGHTAHVLWPNDYGVPFYADVIVTTDDYIKQHPDVVAAFVSATLKGWQKAIEDPAKAADDALVFDPNLDRDFQLASMQATIPLVDTGTIELGLMEEDVWKTMQDILVAQGLMAASVDLTQVYTNEYVEAAIK